MLIGIQALHKLYICCNSCNSTSHRGFVPWSLLFAACLHLPSPCSPCSGPGDASWLFSTSQLHPFNGQTHRPYTITACLIDYHWCILYGNNVFWDCAADKGPGLILMGSAAEFFSIINRPGILGNNSPSHWLKTKWHWKGQPLFRPLCEENQIDSEGSTW